MITKYDIVKYLNANADKLNIRINDDQIYNQSGDHLCSVDDYVKKFKLNHGCSFESIYYNHAFLQNILKCNKCGTIIFTNEDEDYEPSLTCPVCTNYHTKFMYWTKDEIENDKNKQNTIQNYIDAQNKQNEDYEFKKNVVNHITL